MACHVVKMSQALRKSHSSEKVVYEYFDTYDICLFSMPMKDTQNCIQTSWNALILLRIRPRINHFLLINKQCIQMSKARFSQSQAQMPIHSAKIGQLIVIIMQSINSTT